ncbi:MAG: glycosyltransferase [Trueperaceae bacterium]|nr:glycosyltransferase [Trueperaceae bacterium]
MQTALIVALYLVEVPYLALMIMVIVGALRSTPLKRTSATPSVSVIVPAHDEERDLPATLASLAAQEYGGRLEFVVIDDRSTDGTAAVIERFAREDPRFRPVSVTAPSRRLAPKVNAVEHGLRAATGELVLATDADCVHDRRWVAGMASYFAADVVMVAGYVSTSRRGEARTLLDRFESVDWFTLMLVSRSLTRFGLRFASSANNLAYRRSAFEAVGGFGAAGRAPSGDEDLLTQKLGRLPGAKVVFADDHRCRVLTRGAEGAPQLLRQQRRWVSRYHHVLHYHPGFLAGIAILGLQSVLLTLAVLLCPVLPGLVPWVLGLWAVKAGIEFVGMGVGTRQWDRRDLWGVSTLWWSLLHPPFIATASIGSFLKPSAWYAGADGYRRRYLQRRLREFRRRARQGLARP